MKPIFLLAFFPVLMSLSNCKSTQKTTMVNNSQTVSSDVPKLEKKDTDLMRFTISFISKGAGIDHKIKTKFDTFFNDYLTNNKVTINLIKSPWGREGETDYCFDFGNIKETQIVNFIQKSKEILSGSDRINMGENVACQGLKK